MMLMHMMTCQGFSSRNTRGVTLLRNEPSLGAKKKKLTPYKKEDLLLNLIYIYELVNLCVK
jgi:hypothetical protein